MPKSPFKKSKLANGVRVLSETYPSSHAVTLGIWVLTGTRDEPKSLGGISHFLEHLVFKGTKTRSTLEIAMALESVGGELNAYTTKEYTCYHTLSLKEHMELSLEVLTDLVTSATFPVDEFRREKKVVLQEIAMSREEYGELVYDYYLKESLGSNPAGRPILGDEKTLSHIQRKDVIDYYKTHHYGDNIIVAAAGCVDHDKLVDLVEKHLGKLRSKGKRGKRKPAQPKPIRELVNRPSEQVHILVGMPAVSFKSPRRYESYLVNTLLGGGMTSRLYQSVREKKGLAYSVYSYVYSFVDFAISLHYAGTDQANSKKTVEVILKELHRLKNKGVTAKDVQFFKTQIKGNILLTADDLESRMTSLAHNEMIFGKYRTVDEVVGEINAITASSVNEFLRTEFSIDQLGIMMLGNLPKTKTESWLDQLS